MARDRKRAKQRRERRDRLAPADAGQAGVSGARPAAPSPPSQPEPTEGVPPGTPEVPPAGARSGGLPSAVAGGPKELDAALAAGAAGRFDEEGEEQAAGSPQSGNGDGVAVETLRDEPLDDTLKEREENGAAGETGEDDAAATSTPVVQRKGGEVADGRRRRSGAPSARTEAHAGRQSLLARTVAFLRASWAELQRMQWPDRRHTSQATAVVLGFVVVAGLYLGAADWVAQKLVNLIL